MSGFDALAAYVSAATATLGLAFLGVQIRKSNSLAFLAAHNTLTERVMSIDLLLFEHPDIEPFLRGNALLANLSEHDTDRILAVLEYVADVMENALIHRRYLGRKAIVWEPYLTYFVCNSPALRQFIASNEEWYVEDVHAFISRVTSP